MNNLSPMNSRMQIVEGKTPIISGVFQRWLNDIYKILYNIEQGEYTPILTSDFNSSSISAFDNKFYYSKQGNMVNVFGVVIFKADAVGQSAFYCSIPIGQQFGVCAGSGGTITYGAPTNGNTIVITPDLIDFTKVWFVVSNSTLTSYALPYVFNFSYNIK